MARRLAAEPGLQAGDRVALVGDATLDYLADFFIMAIGECSTWIRGVSHISDSEGFAITVEIDVKLVIYRHNF